jgi:hypothetical protein
MDYEQIGTKEACSILKCGQTVFYTKIKSVNHDCLGGAKPTVIIKGSRNYYLKSEIIKITMAGWN